MNKLPIEKSKGPWKKGKMAKKLPANIQDISRKLVQHRINLDNKYGPAQNWSKSETAKLEKLANEFEKITGKESTWGNIEKYSGTSIARKK